MLPKPTVPRRTTRRSSSSSTSSMAARFKVPAPKPTPLRRSSRTSRNSSVVVNGDESFVSAELFPFEEASPSRSGVMTRARRSSIYPGLELDLPEMSSNKKLPLSLRRLSTVPEKPKVRRTRAAQAKTNLEENNASKFVRGAGQENGHTETGASASTFHALGEETTESEVTGKTMDIREEKKLSGSSRKPPRVIHNARKNNTVKTKSPKRDLCNSVPTCPLAKEVRVMLNRREAKHVRQTTSVVDSSDKQSLRAASPLSLIESPLKSCSPKSQSSRSPLRNVENSLVFDQTGTPLKVPLAGAQEDVLQSNLWTGDLHKACVIISRKNYRLLPAGQI